jgi:hypothetical protein
MIGVAMCVQDWCPYMPLAPDKPYLYVEGEGKVELEGVALMCPELNQEELIAGRYPGSCVVRCGVVWGGGALGVWSREGACGRAVD